MSAVGNRAAVGVWVFLVVATLGSGWIAEHPGAVGQWAVAFLMLVAYLKGRAVMMVYMDLREAPFAWRLAFEVWGVVATGVIIVGWLVAGR